MPRTEARTGLDGTGLDGAGLGVGWVVVEVAAADTYPLRSSLLRRDRPDLDLHLPDDDLRGAFHLAVTCDAGGVVGVASLMPQPPEFPAAAPAWRLRQMAVAPAVQGRGAGAALFQGALARLRERGAATLWAESRDTSLGFYLACGMTTVAGRRYRIGDVAYTDVVMELAPPV